MPYRILLEAKAEKNLEKLPKEVQKRITQRILNLKDTPRPFGVTKINTANEWYRVRVGDWRILYEIDDKAKKIIVLRVRHRKEVYKNL